MGASIKARALVTAIGAVLVAVACGTSSSASGGTVKVMAEWSGQEQANFLAVVKPFEDQTGIKVSYESTRDLTAVIKTRVAAGNPPDLAGVPNPQLLSQFASQGKLTPLDGVLDMSALKQNYSQGWIDLGTYQGKLYQVYSWVSLKGLVWYNPKNFTAKGYQVPKTWSDLISLQSQIKSSGVTPWCIGLKSGGADDGWAGSDWIKEIVLSQSGPTVYDNWVAGKQKWTSPEIKSAFTTWGTILGANDSNVYGGANEITSASFKTSGDGLFTSPPKCYMHNQASFITSFFTSDNPSVQPGTDFNFFPLPDVSSQYTGAHVVAGDSWGLFHDTPQARKLLQYLTTADAQAIWVKAGGKLSPNKQTPLSDYPDALSKESAQILVGTQIAKYDATDNMPADMRTAAWQAVLKFVQNQGNLDSILTNLDKVQQTAYASS
ncbi:MAG TPA: ABC transporter substrate-binding protein [Candidatus Dormibacteraeota bacterium]|nr:ABC transporter substrate-binding protein [Candidatus Dormibacteraeota bacterium]